MGRGHDGLRGTNLVVEVRSRILESMGTDRELCDKALRGKLQSCSTNSKEVVVVVVVVVARRVGRLREAWEARSNLRRSTGPEDGRRSGRELGSRVVAGESC